MGGAGQRFSSFQLSLLYEPGERLLERERSIAAREGDFLVQVLYLVFPNVLTSPTVLYVDYLYRKNICICLSNILANFVCLPYQLIWHSCKSTEILLKMLHY